MSDEGKVVLVRYHSKESLHQAYMSFCRDGGLFVPTTEPYALQAPVFLLAELPGAEAISARGRVVWISSSRRKGVGVRIHPDEAGKLLRRAIENLLGPTLGGPAPTLTM